VLDPRAAGRAACSPPSVQAATSISRDIAAGDPTLRHALPLVTTANATRTPGAPRSLALMNPTSRRPLPSAQAAADLGWRSHPQPGVRLRHPPPVSVPMSQLSRGTFALGDPVSAHHHRGRSHTSRERRSPANRLVHPAARPSEVSGRLTAPGTSGRARKYSVAPDGPARRLAMLSSSPLAPLAAYSSALRCIRPDSVIHRVTYGRDH
jgi:hypothetical protein